MLDFQNFDYNGTEQGDLDNLEHSYHTETEYDQTESGENYLDFDIYTNKKLFKKKPS